MLNEAVCSEEHDEIPSSGVDPTVIERAASLLRALGDTARLRLLEQLIQRERCVSELAASSEEGMSTISQRLRTLRAEGLVSRRRDGKHIYYRPADSHVVDLVRVVLEHAAEDLSPHQTQED